MSITHRTRTFPIFLVFILTGCVTNTASELRRDPTSFDGQVNVARTPEDTYRMIREISRECLEQAPLGTPVISEGDFDVQTKTGQILQRMIAQGVLLNMTIIDLYPADSGGTNLKLYTIKGWKSIGVDMPTKDDLVRWISGDKTCWRK